MDHLRGGLLPVIGRVEAVGRSPWWVVVFPDEVHEPCREWLRDLAACDCSVLTMRSYAFDLLRWLRFLHVIGTGWGMAGREQVRDFVEYLREAPNPQQLRRSPDAPALGSVNKVTGKPYPRPGYAARTINHQLSVLSAFYAFAVDADLGPLVNPVPAQRPGSGADLVLPVERGRLLPGCSGPGSRPWPRASARSGCRRRSHAPGRKTC